MQTNTTHHVLNNHAWLQFIQSSSQQKSNSFAGIILTGWSRFDHFMPLCDLLPTAYRSLLSSLFMLNIGRFLYSDLMYDCGTLLMSMGKDSQLCQLLPGRKIIFERKEIFFSRLLGTAIWSSISSLSLNLAQIEERLTFLHTVAPLYNRKHLFVRRCELDSRLNELAMLRSDLLTATQILNGQFYELYSLDVIDEWFDLYITPILGRINTTLIEFSPVRNQTSWSRRPLI
jgi:hexosaminidase